MKRLEFWDTTLRDAHQSLWATRMTSAMMEPIVGTMGEVGYWNLCTAGSAVFDSCIYYLAENPWDRLDMIHAATPRQRKSVYFRSLNLLGWDLFADDVFPFAAALMNRHGLNVINTFDALNDTANMAPSIKATLDAGLHSVGSIVFTLSPVHDDTYFVRKAKELVALGVHGVQLKDSGALLNVDRVRVLVPKLRAAIGDQLMLHFHTHCTSGLGPLVTLEALPLGVDVVHSAISPLANGTSQPATELIAREARLMRFEVPLDDTKMKAQADHFRTQAIRHGKPLGQPMAYDPGLYRHQLPGGMISNLARQMHDLGQSDRMPALLEEIVRLREELGYPIMVSPMSQFVGVQALFNIMHGQRYRVVVTEIKRYCLGWYGKPAAPIDANVLDRVSDGEAPITVRPGSLLEPMMPGFRKLVGPGASDEDLFLAMHYKEKLLTDWRKMRQDKISYPTPRTPVATLLKELTARPDVAYLQVRKDDTRLTYVA
ncbi:MAG: pyruvate carboxylase subunit B [Alphaproteobacteria bacterium]|nr:pyruvate carboxylase subunit B [Alphaproteobacteria bacterium]